MSESEQHLKLVKSIVSFAEKLIENDNICFMTVDTTDNTNVPPLTAEGFRPDVFYQYKDIMIIGEAKTSEDVCRTHSKQQYESYIRKCSLFEGKAYFVAAVLWMDKAALHNILSKIQKKYPGNYTITILEGF